MINYFCYSQFLVVTQCVKSPLMSGHEHQSKKNAIKSIFCVVEHLTVSSLTYDLKDKFYVALSSIFIKVNMFSEKKTGDNIFTQQRDIFSDQTVFHFLLIICCRPDSSVVLEKEGILWLIVFRIRMVWVGMDSKDHLLPTLLPWAGTPTTRPGFLHPDWP